MSNASCALCRVQVLLLGISLLVNITGCANRTNNNPPRSSAQPLPTYEAIATQYNQRTDRLTRIWSRAVVQVRYEDEKGQSRRQQGEGHLQLVQPNNVALSIGKLGEVLFWLGADEERFWIFELGDQDRVSVSRHENAGKPCAQAMSVPVHPLVFVQLLGISSLPLQADATVFRDPESNEIVIELPLEKGFQRLKLDPDLLVPHRIELYNEANELFVWADLSEYERIAMKGSPGFNPQVASQIAIESADASASLRVFLSDTSDGIAIGRIPDAVFDFETLVRAHRPASMIVLDEQCEFPAVAIEHDGAPGT